MSRIRSRTPWIAAAGLIASLAFLILPLLSGCATRPAASQASPPREWRLVPTTTVLGERRQYFVHGERLEGAQAVSDPSVKVEPGPVSGEGRIFSLYLTVSPLGDQAAGGTVSGEKPGLRKVKVTTPDTAVTLELRVVDER